MKIDPICPVRQTDAFPPVSVTGEPQNFIREFAALKGYMMQGCEILFTADEAVTVRRELARAMGADSPCVRCAVGARCPLLPDDLSSLLVAKTPTG